MFILKECTINDTLPLMVDSVAAVLKFVQRRLGKASSDFKHSTLITVLAYQYSAVLRHRPFSQLHEE
jgi:hypothetical protein